MPNQKFLTIDIGSTWTKVFLSSIDSENSLNIEKSARLPTCTEEPSFSTNLLLSDFSEKEAAKIFVSSLPEVEELAKKLGGEFVKEEEAGKALATFFKKAESDVVLFDAGSNILNAEFETKEIGKFLTFSINEISLENLLGNRKFRPASLPNSLKELEVEESFLRNSLARTLEERAHDKKLFIVATGGLVSGTPNISRLSLIILDILRENEIAQVAFDREFFLPSFGGLLSIYKQLQVANPGSWFDYVGAFISLGKPLPLKLNWGYSQLQEIELSKDEVAIVPASKDQTIELSFVSGKEKKTVSVKGGSLGLLLDSRPKPLQLFFGQESSRAALSRWQQMLEKTKIEESF
jgi:hypothetical protein